VKIDAHQHFWQYHPVEHAWISENMGILRQDYLPADLKPLLDEAGMDGCVAVQASQSEAETRFLLQLAADHPFIRGVVGWVDLQAPNVEERLQHFSQHPRLRGIRHIVQDEPDDEFLLRPEFLRGVAQLRRFGLCYDILIHPRHLAVARTFVEKFPDQPFVLDHLAKPFIRDQRISPWAEDLRALATFPHVTCKLSGMVTEAAWNQWKPADFRPYLDVAFEAFGPDRLMIGSDWPVCRLSAAYAETMGLVNDYLRAFSQEEQAKVWGLNAVKFYGLPGAD
jgi:L-fuconolactonase